MQTIHTTIKTNIYSLLLDSKYKLLEFIDEIGEFVLIQRVKFRERIHALSDGSNELGDRILLFLFGTKLLLEFEDIEALEPVVEIPEGQPMAMPVVLFQVSAHSAHGTDSDNTIKTPEVKVVDRKIPIPRKTDRPIRTRVLVKRFLRFLFLKQLERWESILNQKEISCDTHTTNPCENRFKT